MRSQLLHMQLPVSHGQTRTEHQCSGSPGFKDHKAFEFHERLSAAAIVLSVAITFLEACYISNANMRMFADCSQAVFAFTFCALQGYNLRCYSNKRDLACSESLKRFFVKNKDANWNLFDLVLNLISILDMFLDTFEGRFVHALSAVRVVRILRLIRLLGSNKFVDNFSKVSQMAAWEMLNFSAVIFAFLVVLSILATNMLWDFPDAEVAAAYGNLGATMWTLFKILTMDGWIDTTEPVITLHPGTLYFYAIYVFLSLSSVSIVPAIFIDVLLEDRDRERREKKRRKRAALQRARRNFPHARIQHQSRPAAPEDRDTGAGLKMMLIFLWALISLVIL